VLPVDEAFALTALIEADDSIVLLWDIRDAYYLYQSSLLITSADGTVLTGLILPEAEQITDEFFGATAIYRDRLLVEIPLQRIGLDPGESVELLLSYQGCAEKLYCYPPVQKAVTLTLPE
jgi:thiol:disulfide interchange protein DsbD